MKKLLALIVIAIIATAATRVAAQKAFPDKTWEKIYQEGPDIYGSSTIVTNFSAGNPGLTVAGIPAPAGYSEDTFEGGDYSVSIFRDCRVEGNKAYFTADVYTPEYDPAKQREVMKPSGKKWSVTAVCNPDGSLDTKWMSGSDNFEQHFLNPDRQRYVIVNYGHNVNIRKAPVNGAVVTKAEKGSLYKLKGTKEIPGRQGATVTWYEVSLPDGSSGFISGEFATIAYDEDGNDPAKFGDAPFKSDASYSEVIKDYNDDEVGIRAIRLARVGDKVFMEGDEMYFNGRLHGAYYAVGHIDGNSIVFTKDVYEQLPVGAQEAFMDGDYSKLESLMSPTDEFRIYYYCGQLYYGGDELQMGME